MKSRLIALAAVLLALGLIAVHLHVPNTQTTWRVVPRAQARQEECMSVSMPQGPVNVNTALLEELDTLPGIGPVLAERIVAWRDENGPFTAVDELGEVSGIGPAVLEDVRDLVRV